MINYTDSCLKEISAITMAMNRSDRLVHSIGSWVNSHRISEYIVVDWSSTPPIYDDPRLKHLVKHPKVKVVRVENEKYFVGPSLSLNVAWTHATKELVLRIDADMMLTNDTILEMGSSMGDGQFMTSDVVPHTNYFGFSIIPLFALYALNGYNEYFRGWGHEDNDLYERLMDYGLKKVQIEDPTKYMYHIPHDNGLRVENYPDSLKDLDLTCYQNSVISDHGRIFKYKTLVNHGNYKIISRIKLDDREFEHATI